MKNAVWSRNPINAFLSAKEKFGLVPAKPAEKHTLLRRVYLDLIGLPPTPEQLQAFRENNSTDAYEKVVRDLLDSSQHGERLLIGLWTGTKPNKRLYEMICLYFAGWATAEELCHHIEKNVTKQKQPP